MLAALLVNLDDQVVPEVITGFAGGDRLKRFSINPSLKQQAGELRARVTIAAPVYLSGEFIQNMPSITATTTVFDEIGLILAAIED